MAAVIESRVSKHDAEGRGRRSVPTTQILIEGIGVIEGSDEALYVRYVPTIQRLVEGVTAFK